jgi:hypothetical protein
MILRPFSCVHKKLIIGTSDPHISGLHFFSLPLFSLFSFALSPLPQWLQDMATIVLVSHGRGAEVGKAYVGGVRGGRGGRLTSVV